MTILNKIFFKILMSIKGESKKDKRGGMVAIHLFQNPSQNASNFQVNTHSDFLVISVVSF